MAETITISKEATEKTISANGTKSTSTSTTNTTTTTTITSSSSSISTPAATSSQSATNWTAAQQAQLERALQIYPPTWKGDGDRWDKAVDDKTKKECRLRVKYLSEQVKAKKAAMAADK